MLDCLVQILTQQDMINHRVVPISTVYTILVNVMPAGITEMLRDEAGCVLKANKGQDSPQCLRVAETVVRARTLVVKVIKVAQDR